MIPINTISAGSLKPLSLRKNFSWAFWGNLIYGVCQSGLLIILSKLGTTDLVGQFSLGIAINTPVFTFTYLQLRSVQVTDVKKEYEFKDYLSLRILSSIIAILIIIIICAIAMYPFNTTLIIISLAINRGIESVSDIFYGLMQFHERMDYISISMMMRGLGYLMAMALGIYFCGNLIWAVGIICLFSGLTIVLYDLPCSYKIMKKATHNPGDQRMADRSIGSMLWPRWSRKISATIIKLSLPVGLASMLLALTSDIPRYLIERYHGASQLGIYSAMFYFILAGVVVVMALGQSASPRLAKYYSNSQNKKFVQLVMKLICMGFILGGTGVFLAWLIGPQLLTFLFRPEYAQYPMVFILLTVAGMLSYVGSFLWVSITASRYFKIQIVMSLVMALTSLWMSYWLIPAYGLLGAAWAMVICFGTQVIFGLGVVYVVVKNMSQERGV